MRTGYFKVEQTNMHAAIIFPSHFVGGTLLTELRTWLDRRGIQGPIVYAPARIVVVPITETGVPN